MFSWIYTVHIQMNIIILFQHQWDYMWFHGSKLVYWFLGTTLVPQVSHLIDLSDKDNCHAIQLFILRPNCGAVWSTLWESCNSLIDLNEIYCGGWLGDQFLVTHWGWDQMSIIFPEDIFKCIFLNKNVSVFIKISLKFLLEGPINNILVLVQIMA